MLLNLDRCIGCYTCVVACKMAHGTRPGVNYNSVKTFEYGEYPNAKQRYMLEMCMHCDDAPCVSVCPTAATAKSEEGAVTMDYEACIGCGACVTACPYNKRFLVKDNETTFEGEVLPYEEESVERLNVVEKCTFCQDRVKVGMQPACVEFCPGQCRIFGDVDDPESEISQQITKLGAKKIEGTSIYYAIPEGMDTSILPLPLVEAIAQANKPVEETPVEEKKDNSGLIAGVGVAALAAAGAGIAIKKNKDKKDGVK